ncbi:hypothetical protein PCANC_07925 [Puccinia coronata f. sp. avenae]|uniref:Cation/H+ exchanger transmembrane domain-containing protein n=1 Tax=Puccinia coronata f. sp. avenae TaxID=200324 RepID=A0A2N5UY71_9BASI|nr:hypothetical protein PCANC_07925 [Puccinia coronata f. sp. avenae]
MLAVTFGILLGPHVAGVFDPRSWNKGQDFAEVSLEVTRIIVALDVFSVGVELPPAYLLRHWRTMLCLLGPVMLAGWFIAGAFILIFVPSLTYLEALVISACICPTDILLATSVVGKGNYAKNHVPAHLRHLLQAEAGTNDGIAILFLYLAMFILLRSKDHSVGHAIGSWAILILLYHILLAIIMGAVIGFFARILLRFCKRRLLMDNESMVPMYISLALLTAGVCILAGTEDIVAAFACGTAFGWGGHLSEEIEASNFSEIVSHLVNIFAFIYVGATIPFKAWNDAILTLVPWKMVLLALAILLLRRLPIMLLLRRLMPELKTDREALFCAHFGPVGVSGLFISFLAVRKLPEPQIPAKSSLDVLALTIQPIVYLSLKKYTLGRAQSEEAGQFLRIIGLVSDSIDVAHPLIDKARHNVQTESGALQFEELDPFQSTAVSPILPQVSAVSPFQSISIPQDAGLEAGTHSRQGIGSTNQ